MNLDEIQQIFFQECEEGLAAMEASFATIRESGYDHETINTVFRAVHSIKGGAGAFGHERLQGFTHEYETLLDLVRNGTLTLTSELLTIILGAFDMLADHVASARDGGESPADAAMLERLAAACIQSPGGGPAESLTAHAAEAEAPAPKADAPADDGFDDLFAMCDASAEPGDTEPAGWRVTLRPGADALANGGEPLLLLRELAHLGGEVVEVDLSSLPPLDQLEVERPCLAWTVIVPATVSEDDIRAVFEFTGECDLTIESVGAVVADTGADILSGEPAPEMLGDPGAEPQVAVPAPPPTAAAGPEAEATATNVVPLTKPAAAPPPRAATPAAAQSQTIRVELDKLDRLVNLVGELVITQAMLAQRLSEQSMADTPELNDLDHLTRELQESTMAIRAQPMKTVFSRVPRIIRELEMETGKRVRLDIEGEMTEVDKTVVERIGEPLTHLIRNAVDHGLEAPDERVEAGKPAEGVIRLAAAHHSGRIVITVADDGRGINRDRVRAKAVERGIISADAALTEEEIDNLIFAPGFSTAATVTNVSGRGVGMDVVRKSVQALGGRIGIQSQLGHGSTFSLSLPLTLAVLDGMVVTIGDQTFVIPLGHVVESLRPGEGAVDMIGPEVRLLDVRGAYVPVHRVAEHLGIAGAASDPTKAVLIVVESDQGRAVLMVDNIQDQRQVVVKSLESNYQAVPGLAGATILGDGRVALILDVDSLISRWRREARQATQSLAA